MLIKNFGSVLTFGIVVEEFSDVVDPLGGADKAEAHAEAHEAADSGHEVDVADLVFLDDAGVVGLLEEDLQDRQVFLSVTYQDFQVVWIDCDCSVESEVALEADVLEVEVVVVGRANVAEGIDG